MRMNLEDIILSKTKKVVKKIFYDFIYMSYYCSQNHRDRERNAVPRAGEKKGGGFV